MYIRLMRNYIIMNLKAEAMRILPKNRALMARYSGKERWDGLLENDPYYNPNMTLKIGGFTIK